MGHLQVLLHLRGLIAWEQPSMSSHGFVMLAGFDLGVGGFFLPPKFLALKFIFNNFFLYDSFFFFFR